MPNERTDETSSAPSLEALLVEHQDHLRQVVSWNGAGVLRYETADDLAQQVSLELLRRGGTFEYQGAPEFLAFLSRVAKRHLSNRRKYWKARKRDAGALLRISTAESGQTSLGGVNPAASQTGPSTFAMRRERYELAMRCIPVLSARDQAIIEKIGDGCGIDELAEHLGVSRDAAVQARLRALKRFEKVLELATRGVGP